MATTKKRSPRAVFVDYFEKRRAEHADRSQQLEAKLARHEEGHAQRVAELTRKARSVAPRYRAAWLAMEISRSSAFAMEMMFWCLDTFDQTDPEVFPRYPRAQFRYRGARVRVETYESIDGPVNMRPWCSQYRTAVVISAFAGRRVLATAVVAGDPVLQAEVHQALEKIAANYTPLPMNERVRSRAGV